MMSNYIRTTILFLSLLSRVTYRVDGITSGHSTVSQRLCAFPDAETQIDQIFHVAQHFQLENSVLHSNLLSSQLRSHSTFVVVTILGTARNAERASYQGSSFQFYCISVAFRNLSKQYTGL